ncbi:peptidoglycan-binding protein [Streptomyces kaniharaensis]|uniref:Peptidoglycan-binding protein n=1 Tax=Streptomyces kaniharaensis TaxID=212423 RepID=A0A6N7L1I4_9ACTN|nr:peptidoglycan-binding domain-containing protein [Streptomyces kaniharaensis]MQS16557.1 peptidoglycan-binding protein [Streptomyces kaniharaensis]
MRRYQEPHRFSLTAAAGVGSGGLVEDGADVRVEVEGRRVGQRQPHPRRLAGVVLFGAGDSAVEADGWFRTSGSDHAEPAEDGSFGPETKQAIKNFQEEMGLPQDGVLGPQTGNALMAHGDPTYTGSDMPYRAGGGTSTSYCYTYLPTTWH